LTVKASDVHVPTEVPFGAKAVMVTNHVPERSGLNCLRSTWAAGRTAMFFDTEPAPTRRAVTEYRDTAGFVVVPSTDTATATPAFLIPTCTEHAKSRLGSSESTACSVFVMLRANVTGRHPGRELLSPGDAGRPVTVTDKITEAVARFVPSLPVMV
jgi:hypothetical protein